MSEEFSGDLQIDRQQLELQRDYILSWINHPITREVQAESDEEESAHLVNICDKDVFSVETFLAHFTAIGHVREIRRRRALVKEKLDEIVDKIKQL